MSFGNEIKTTNITENWLFDIIHNNGTLRLSFQDYVDGSNFYHGVILNRPSIRESIDLKTAVSKTSNISIDIADFNYEGNPISEFIYGGSNYFINKNVDVKIIINQGTGVNLASFKINSISYSNGVVSIQMNHHIPWADVTFPQTKTTSNNLYIPVSYGNYTKNSATTYASPLFESQLTSEAYRPVLYNKDTLHRSIYVDGVDTSSDAELAVYEKNFNVFVPLENAESDTSNTDGAEHGKSDFLQIRSFQQRATDATEVSTQSGVTVSNLSNAIDGDNSTYASASVNLIQTDTVKVATQDFSFSTVSGKSSSHITSLKQSTGNVCLLAEDLDTSETGVNIDNDDNVSNYDVVKVGSEKMLVTSSSSNTLTVVRGFDSNAQTHDNDDIVGIENTINILYVRYQVIFTTDVGNNSIRLQFQTDGNADAITHFSNFGAGNRINALSSHPEKLRIRITFTCQEAGGQLPSLNAEVRIYDVYLVTQRVSNEPQDKLFVANDGFLDNGWINGSTLVTGVHQVHRDLLSRFANLANSDPTGWSDLNTSRTQSGKEWLARYWALEPQSLQKTLEMLQYEGGFIYHNGKYKFVKDSYSASDSETLTKSDVSDINIGITSYSDILSKIIVNFKKNAGNDKYFTSTTATNATTRTNYSIDDGENQVEVNLDAYVAPAIPTTPASNSNDDFYTYYDNIFGEPKLTIKGRIVNPAYYNLEAGDIIDFSNMQPEKAFGKSFANVAFMIISLQRTSGILNFEAREIGVIT